MNNIDKDIEIVNELVIQSRDLREEEFYKLIGIKQIQATSNVLTELETYKKMVKKLVERIIERMKDESTLDGNCYEEFGVTFCKRANDDCNKCIIDWARNEVEKDEEK